MKLYTAEELCYYIYNNIYLIGQDFMNILSTQWKPNNTLEITLSNDYVIILKDVSFANYLALSSNPTLLDKMILSRTNW